MKSEQRSAKFLKTRKLLLVAPVLVIPFAIFFMWSLGIVGNARANTGGTTIASGMNLNLPSAAAPKDSNWNKLKYYEQAEKDSVNLKSKLKNDRLLFGLDEEEDFESMKGVSDAELAERMYGAGQLHNKNHPTSSEDQVYDRLSRIQREISKESLPRREAEPTTSPSPPPNPEIENLSGMMSQMQGGEDPELGQLDQMLDKIIAIQNPQKLQDEHDEKMKASRGQVFTVQADTSNINVSTLEPEQDRIEPKESNGFYSLDNTGSQKAGRNSVRAVIHETQTLINGATVKLRLVDAIRINGVLIPKETFIHGIASLSGERLRITVSSIRYGSQLFPVQLTVYDMDGLDGVRVPGAISKQVVQQSTDRGLQGLGFNTVGSSMGIQAAGLGVEAAKSFLSRKVKQVRVTIKAGYEVLLKDGKQKD
jgi:conjugative transposon TraM protein